MNKTLAVFLLSLWHEILAEEYSIVRRLSANGNVLPDRFILPPPICANSAVSVYCTTRGGQHVLSNNGCTCQCDADKSTFGFYNSWRCIENTKFHDHSGCTLRLNDRSKSSPIITISRERSARSYFLPTLQSSINCDVTNEGSNLTCNGTWEPLNSGLVKETFEMWQYEQKWYFFTKRRLDGIKGQILRLNVECQGPSSDHYCVILKVKGKLRCPLPPTSSQSTTTVPLTTRIRPRPPSLPITIQTITTTKPTITNKRTSQESGETLTNPITYLSILPDPVSSRPDLTVGHGSTPRTKDSRLFTATTSLYMKKLNKGASEERDKSGLIAGIVAGIIGLVIIVIAIMVIKKKRKKRNSDEQRANTVDNAAGYGRGVDYSLRFNGQQSTDEDKYSYAYINAAPFAKTDKQDLESHANNDQEPGSSVTNLKNQKPKTENLNQKGSAPYNDVPVYNTLEEPVYAKVDMSRQGYPFSSDAPIYNTLEEPEYAKVDKRRKTKPSAENNDVSLYNVLEGPETYEGLEGLEGLSDDSPCYQVLEGPFSEGSPVYDVLEEPESHEAPVYGALKGRDPCVYGALDNRNVQVSSEKNIGYNDKLYDSVGDVLNDQGDIYQQLDQCGQRNSNVYQALNQPGKTMYLNDMSQTQSTV